MDLATSWKFKPCKKCTQEHNCRLCSHPSSGTSLWLFLKSNVLLTKLIQADQDDGEDDAQVKSVLQQQASLVRQQDEQLVLISGSVGTLKSMSRRIGNELDEQAL